MIFSGLENSKKEKRDNQKVVSLFFGSLNRSKTDFSLSGVSDVLMEFFPHPEGYVNVTLGTTGNRIFNYVYYYTDHLGNIRLTYTKDMVSNQLKIMDENHYYPFGLKHQKYSPAGSLDLKAESADIARPGYVTSTPFMYRYNGKEYQDELGLNMYDMDMRQYDPAIARWVVLDPVIHHSMSPYNAFDNNPVFWADPSGADSIFDQGGGGSSPTNATSYGPSPEMEGPGENQPDHMRGKNLIPNGKIYSNGGPPTGDPIEGPINKDPILLEEAVITGKAPVSSNPYDNPNVAAAAEGLYAAQMGSPAVQDMDAWIKSSLSWVPGGGFQYIPEMQSAFSSGNYVGTGVYAMGMMFGKVGGTGGKIGSVLWSSTGKLSPVKNAYAHFAKHGAEFPEFYNALQYVNGTKNFLNNSPAGTLIKTRTNGDVLKYHPGTNTFGVMNASGAPRTMFRPTDGMQYWLKQ